jgi:hypothetical protein
MRSKSAGRFSAGDGARPSASGVRRALKANVRAAALAPASQPIQMKGDEFGLVERWLGAASAVRPVGAGL